MDAKKLPALEPASGPCGKCGHDIRITSDLITGQTMHACGCHGWRPVRLIRHHEGEPTVAERIQGTMDAARIANRAARVPLDPNRKQKQRAVNCAGCGKRFNTKRMDTPDEEIHCASCRPPKVSKLRRYWQEKAAEFRRQSEERLAEIRKAA